MEQALARIEMLYIEKDSIHWEMFKNDCMEKEKEQICNAYTDGLEGPYIGAEEYYNQTYNQDRVTINETKMSIEEIGKLMYYKDTTIGLWATDRLDLIPDEIKHLFFKLK